MRILLTGAAGFIGHRVAEVLLDNNHSVFGIDNLCPAYDLRLKEYRLTTLHGRLGYEFQEMDIADRDSLAAVWRDWQPFDAVVNLAARAGVRQSVEDPWVYLDTNIVGTLNLLDLCRRNEVGKFVLASTSSLYGSDNPVPFSEDLPTDKPLSPYAASKKGAEAICYTYHHLYGIDITILRYFTVYGPAGRPDMSVFRFIQWIHEGFSLRLYGDGTQSRDFTYVDDVARGTVLGLKRLGCETINLGGDHPHDLIEVISLIEEQVGRKAAIKRYPMHAADVMTTWANIEKAKRLLDWQPEIPLEEGVARLCSWYRENRDWARTIDTED